MHMNLSQFKACLKAADKRLAWSSRDGYYHFIVEEHVLEFSQAEMGQYASYFHRELYMTEHRLNFLLRNGAIISLEAFEDVDVSSLNPNGLGKKCLYAKFQNLTPVRYIPSIEEYAEQMHDLAAQMYMQRYGG